MIGRLYACLSGYIFINKHIYMDVTALENFLSAQTGTEESQLKLTFLDYLNIWYKKLWNDIIEARWEDYFYDYFQANTVVWQTEYTLPQSSSIKQWFKRVISVEVKRSALDQYYTLLTNNNNTEYKQSLDYLEVNLPKTQWIYDIKDSSLFIYPSPVENVTNWLRLQALVWPIDLIAGGWEDSIFPKHTELRDWHYIIWLAAKSYVFQEKLLYNDKNNAEIEYQTEKERMLRSITTKKWPVVWQLPNLDYYKY